MTIKKQFSSFDDLIANAGKPVLVSFYSTWCGYCQSFAPVLDRIKLEMGDRIQVIKINSEKYTELTFRYEVKALPTTLLFIDGELASRIKGVMKESELIQYLQKFF